MKRYIFLILLNMYLFTCFGQKNTIENAKYALNTFFIYNLTYNQIMPNLLPGKLILDDNNSVKGVKILSVSNYKYDYFYLVISNDSIKAVIDPNKTYYNFIWDNGKITKIERYGKEYKIEYNNENLPVKFTQKGLVFGYYKLENVITYSKGQPSEIIYYENNLAKKAVWYRKTRSFNFDKNGVCSIENIYKTDLANIPENLYRSETKCLNVVNDSVFRLKLKRTEITSVYDNKGRIVNRKDSLFRSKTVTDKSFFYSDSLLYKEVTYKYINNELKEKQVKINCIIPEILKDAPEYEHEIGIYSFDKNGDMIYEAKNGKFREKKNNKWSEWKHFVF